MKRKKIPGSEKPVFQVFHPRVIIDVCLDNDLASKPFTPFSGRPLDGLASFAVQTSIV
jgi:hypothetical protein